MANLRRNEIIIPNIEEIKLYDDLLEIYLTSGRVILIEDDAQYIHDSLSAYITKFYTNKQCAIDVKESIYVLPLSAKSQKEPQKPTKSLVISTKNE